jgi:hypothetical protein
MADDELVRAEGGQVASDRGSIENRPLDEQRRRALMRDRVSLLKYLLVLPCLVVVGIVIMWSVSTSAGRHGTPTLGLYLLMPVIFIILWTWYSISNRRDSQKDLKSGTYACYTGPIRLQAYKETRYENSPKTVYRLALGTYKTFILDDEVIEQLRPCLPTDGQADLAVHVNDLFEVRDESGKTLYLSKQMRKFKEANRRA